MCHPKIIETGLDLLSHPSLIFYQSGYSLHTLRQASRRSWRIGQRQPVRVFYLHYKETLQAACLRLMGKKMLVSLAMEGKFSNGGLQSLGEDDDILTAMARELVTEHGIGESADAVWRQLQAERARILPSRPVVPKEPEFDAAPAPLPPSTLTIPDLASTLKFAMPPPPKGSRKQQEPSPGPEQFSLF